MKTVFFVIILFLASLSAQAQRGDTLRKNTIKLDISSYWLYRNAAVLSYERVIKNQSFHTWGITAGLQQLPSLSQLYTENVDVSQDIQASGFKVGGEYRFYLQKENKYRAPRGVYIGPYTSFHNYQNTRSLDVNNNGSMEFADLITDINILNVGVQLGYQFVLNNRWTIDMVFVGPSISNYRLASRLEGTYTFDPDDITNEVMLALIDRFPAFKELINESEFASKGKTSTWAYGFRYQFQVGYHFGRKRK